MKTQSLTTALALLIGAFMWGCQDQASSPVEPEGPQFDKPGDGTCDAAASGGHCHGDGGGNGEDLIATGEALFFFETFDGNGRTCGTCHRALNNLTIDVTASLTTDRAPAPHH